MNRPHDIHLSLIIPAYNEALRIDRTLSRVSAYLSTQSYTSEIIVVDDGSTDATQGAVKRHPHVQYIKLNHNSGKGFAVRTGVEAAKGKFILFSDADLSTPIEEVEPFLDALKADAEIVIGSRAMKDSHIAIHQPWYRETMGKIFNLFVQCFVFRGIKDTQCGFKCFRGGIAKKIFAQTKIDRFSFDVEILYLAKTEGFRIVQIPIHWYNDAASSVHPLKDATKMFLDLIKIRWIHRNR